LTARKPLSAAALAHCRELTARRSEKTRIPVGTVSNGMTVMGHVKRDDRWDMQVLCHCGATTVMQKSNFRKSRSCGCKAIEYMSITKTIHGEKRTPTWNSWNSMHQRCRQKSHKSYADYGGRGIAVCERWSEYVNFREDMGHRPPGTQLDRVDNSRGYSPDNCRWATCKQNNNNRRSSRLIEWRGETHTLTEWTEILGIDRMTVGKRLSSGWDIDRAFTVPPKRQKNNSVFNRTHGASGYQ
jgi:hypothetical protein